MRVSAFTRVGRCRNFTGAPYEWKTWPAASRIDVNGAVAVVPGEVWTNVSSPGVSDLRLHGAGERSQSAHAGGGDVRVLRPAERWQGRRRERHPRPLHVFRTVHRSRHH